MLLITHVSASPIAVLLAHEYLLLTTIVVIKQFDLDFYSVLPTDTMHEDVLDEV